MKVAEDRWSVNRSRAIAPTPGKTVDAAYLVTVSRGEEKREVVVEFEAPSVVASGGYAEEIVRRFQLDEEPPAHLLLECTRNVRVLKGPRKT